MTQSMVVFAVVHILDLHNIKQIDKDILEIHKQAKSGSIASNNKKLPFEQHFKYQKQRISLGGSCGWESARNKV